MPRQAQFIWPILALVASFLAVFGISTLLATPRQPSEAQPTVTRTVTAPPAEPTVSTPSPDGDQPTVAEPGNWLTLTMVGNSKLPWFLLPNENTFCLDPEFAAGWMPVNTAEWRQQNGQWCLIKADRTNGQLVLKFRGK